MNAKVHAVLLNEARAEARRAQREEDRLALCRLCRAGRPSYHNGRGEWVHRVTDRGGGCELELACGASKLRGSS